MQTIQSVIVFGQLASCAIIIIIVMMVIRNSKGEDKRKHFTNEQSRTQSHNSTLAEVKRTARLHLSNFRQNITAAR